MAGSYNHVVTNKQGKLLNPHNFVGMIDSLGDAYETVEEMYGMIHYLASRLELVSPEDITKSHQDIVEEARKNYRRGLQLSPGIQAPIKNKFPEPFVFTPPRVLNG